MDSRSLLTCPLEKRVCPAHKAASKQLVGWREWLSLPDLDVAWIKVKIDSGALTSAIHAFDIEPFDKDGRSFVRFTLHPIQDDDATIVACEAPVIAEREITSSTGHTEQRYVVETRLVAGGESWPIELSLANRDDMGFRMLLGRQAMRGHMVVDPDLSFALGHDTGGRPDE